MPSQLTLGQAAGRLRTGGVIVYPTEAVFGLGCDPFNAEAVERLLAIKRRPAAKGVILIAAAYEQIEPLIDRARLPPERLAAVCSTWPGPHTWLLPCRTDIPEILRGEHDTLALRVTAHPVAAGLCRAFGGPLVSTSANRGGSPPAFTVDRIDPDLLAETDGLVVGATGGLTSPTPIRDAVTGAVIRN